MKAYNAANKYSLIQVGVTIFKVRPSPDLDKSQPAFLQKSAEFDAYPFTFYLFPRTYDGRLLRDVGMEVSMVQMNVLKHGINWNKWLANAVGYVDREETAYIENMISSGVGALTPTLKTKEAKKVEKLYKDFGAWYESKTNLKDNTAGIIENDLDNDPKAFVIKDLKLPVKQALVKKIFETDSGSVSYTHLTLPTILLV